MVDVTATAEPRETADRLRLLSRTYLVALISRQRARLGMLVGGELHELEELRADVPQREKSVPRDRQFGRDDKTSRHLDDHLRAFLKQIVAALSRLDRTARADGLVLATHAELVPVLTRLLPTPLHRKLVASFPADDDWASDWLRKQCLKAIVEIRDGQPVHLTGIGPARHASKHRSHHG